jgi:hypothetical protein
MRFDGSSGFVRIPRSSALDLSGDLTLEMWVNLSVARRQTLLSTGPEREVELTLETSNHLNFYHGNGTSYENRPSSKLSIAPGTWQHVVVTRDTAARTISLVLDDPCSRHEAAPHRPDRWRPSVRRRLDR